MEGLVRVLRIALLASVAGAIPLCVLARGRPGPGLASAVALAVALAVPALGRRFGMPLPGVAELAWLSPFAACWGLGEGWALFEKIPWWDCVAHAAGALAVFTAWSSWAGPRYGSGWRIAAAGLALATFAGVLWELGEFSSDLLLGTTTVSGVADTSRDLASDVAGAAMAALGWSLASAAARRKTLFFREGRHRGRLLHSTGSRV